MTYILVWNGVNGRILASEQVIFDVDAKPDLGFEYDTINLDTNLNLAEYTAQLPGSTTLMKVELDEDQLKKCHDYCDNFLKEQDYEVATYNDEFIYVGTMLKSVAIQHNLRYTVGDIPPTLTSKYDSFEHKWYPVYAAFKEDGYPEMNPALLTDGHLLFLTKKEWDELPERPSAVHSLDFPTSTWMDKRHITRVIRDAIMDIRVYYEHNNIRNAGNYTTTKETASWVSQKAEAEEYLKDNTISTPFLDGFLSKNKDLDKKELCEKILSDYTEEEKYQQGEYHGEMYSYIYRIRKCTIPSEVDEIVKEVYKSIGKYRVINTIQQYPAAEMNSEMLIDTNPESIVFTNGVLYHTNKPGHKAE